MAPPPAHQQALAPWDEAVLAAAVLAVHPAAIGGIRVIAHAGPVLERFVTFVTSLLPGDAPVRRLPPGVDDDRMMGGLDLTATLAARRQIMQRGLLAETHGGLLVIPMAERLEPRAAALIATVLDDGLVRMEREGVSAIADARFGVLALDEGLEDEAMPQSLSVRLGLTVSLHGIRTHEAVGGERMVAKVAAARGRVSHIRASDEMVTLVTETAAAMGIPSLRPPMQALRIARVLAALDGRDAVANADVVQAVRFALLPHALTLPAPAPEHQQAEAGDGQPAPPPESDSGESETTSSGPVNDIVLEAIAAGLPDGLLTALAAGRSMVRSRGSGRRGAAQMSLLRGQNRGSRAGKLHAGARLALVDTVKVAAPWQALRRKEHADQRAATSDAPLLVRSSDIRIRRFLKKSRTTTIFAVDASGSSALHRLSEVKGAVEALLAECYVRRDEVALISFRGQGAELLLPPTRSLTRAKRALAVLPGGGGTPMAAGLAMAHVLAGQVARSGDRPKLVVLTDGQANVALDGKGGRARAAEDALQAARALGASGHATLLIDASPRPDSRAADLAAAMQARYIALPRADAKALTAAVAAVR
jgi:magnesium chelatase subunit D